MYKVIERGFRQYKVVSRAKIESTVVKSSKQI